MASGCPRLALTASLALLAGCGGGKGGGASACPDDVPAQCPGPAPSWASEVSRVVQDRCAVCHSPGGVQAGRSFTSLPSVQRQSGSMLSQVAACRMPPAGATALSDNERRALLGWLVCGAPDD